MSLPQISEIAGGYQFNWTGAEKIQISVTSIHTNSENEIKAEVRVTTSAEGYNPHLLLDRLNLSSGRARKEMAKRLSEEYDTNWEAILEQMAVYTIERVRQGEPVETIIVNGATIIPPQYMVEPFIIRNYPNVFFGDPGSFKSNMSLVISALITLPWHDNHLNLTVPEDPVSVLYLDWETDRDTISWQLSCLQKGMNLCVVPIKYRHCSAPLYYDIEQIQNNILENKIDFVIIDSLGLACGGELNEAGTAIQFFTALRKLRVTSLILAHTSKEKLSANKSIYGSVFFEAQARNIWQLRKRQEPDEPELDLILKNTKSPPFRKRYEDRAYHFAFTDNSMEVAWQNPRSVAEFLETMGTQTRVTEFIKASGPQSPKQIAEALDLTPENARSVILRLKRKGAIVRSQDTDTYGLVYDG